MRPARILLCWEDRYFTGLRAVCRSAVRVLREELGIRGALPLLFDDTARGDGGWKKHLTRDWERIQRAGIPNRGAGPLDHILYVCDADSASRVLEEVDSPPRQGSTQDWHARATECFESNLKKLASDEDRVHGVLLRWHKETLLLAAHDQEEILRILNWEKVPGDGRTQLYANCEPRPDRVEDPDFIDTFRSTGECLGKFTQAFGVAKLRKSDPRVDDVLAKFGQAEIRLLMKRVLDIRNLAEKIVTLSQAVAD